MKSKVNLALNHNVCVDNVDMTKMYLRIIFVNDILKNETWNIEFANIKCFQGFELKFQVFTNFWTNSRHFPGLEMKMTKFPVF